LQLNCYKNHNGHWDVYGRMKWETVSPAITTRFNSYSNGRYGHPDQHRAISLREGATLQSFPLNYAFYGDNQAKIAKMIGNAVPVEFAKVLAKLIYNDLKGINRKKASYREEKPQKLVKEEQLSFVA